MAISFKSGSRNIIFNPKTMTAETVKDADSGEITGYVVIEHYIDEYDLPQQEIYTISEKVYSALISE